MNIRFACLNDVPALLGIYAQYINTPITFECTLPSEAEYAQRMQSILPCYPYLVCGEEGCIAGYAYAHRQKERAAYQWNAELSVYLDPAHTSKGMGKALYSVLIKLLALQGIKTVYGVVTVPNQKSEQLHESMGFTRLGTCHSTGYKLGTWHDVAWFEKQIAPYDVKPEAIIPIQQVPQADLDSVLAEC